MLISLELNSEDWCQVPYCYCSPLLSWPSSANLVTLNSTVCFSWLCRSEILVVRLVSLLWVPQGGNQGVSRPGLFSQSPGGRIHFQALSGCPKSSLPHGRGTRVLTAWLTVSPVPLSDRSWICKKGSVSEEWVMLYLKTGVREGWKRKSCGDNQFSGGLRIHY